MLLASSPRCDALFAPGSVGEVTTGTVVFALAGGWVPWSWQDSAPLLDLELFAVLVAEANMLNARLGWARCVVCKEVVMRGFLAISGSLAPIVGEDHFRWFWRS